MGQRLGITEDDAAIAQAVGQFAQAELEPHAQKLDEEQISAVRYVPQLAEMGIMGMNLPEQWGGPGVSPTALILSLIEIAKCCVSTASMIGAHYLATDSIFLGADDALKEKYLPAAASGQKLGAFALTEPQAGSNPADMRTLARPTDNGYHLQGVKHFISNADAADFIVVYAKTDPQAGHRGISAFVVDRHSEGVEVGPPEQLMGIRAAHAFEVSLDCIVPESNLIGAEGSGFLTAMKVLDNSRLDVAANCIGMSEAALAAALDWASQRQVGGELLQDKQAIQWMLADMKTKLEAAWALTLQALDKRQKGQRFSMESSIAKLFASEAAAFITDTALQIHGGYGFTRDLPLERYVRDARIMRIYEGSSEIQRLIIARSIIHA